MQVASGQQGAGLVGQVSVQRAARQQDVDGFLLAAVQEVVLYGSRGRPRRVRVLHNTQRKSGVLVANIVFP